MARNQIDVKKLENIDIQCVVNVTKQFKARIYIGCKLILLAAWVMGCNINVILNEQDGE